MINVTTTAKDLLHNVLHDALQQSQAENSQEIGLRLTRTSETGEANGGSGPFTLTVDREQAGDQVVEHDGAKVLLVDQSVSTQLDGATLGTTDTPDGRRLTINR